MPIARVLVATDFSEASSGALRYAEMLATHFKSDLVVVGTHGRDILGRLLLGSVAEAVLRRAPCPVLTLYAGVRGVAGPVSETVHASNQMSDASQA